MRIKKTLVFSVVLAALSAFLTEGKAQAQQSTKVAQNYGGSIVRVRKTSADEVTGSPYLLEEWTKGNVKFKDNTTARNGDLKYDVSEDLLVVKGANGEENLFSDPIDEFTLSIGGKVRLFKTGFKGEKGINEKSYFEVVYNGKIKLLKRYSKTVIESRTYNSATVTKKFEESSVYYIAKSNSDLIPIKKNEKSIIDALQKPDLTKYIKDNKLNLKSEDDIARLLEYYDTSI